MSEVSGGMAMGGDGVSELMTMRDIAGLAHVQRPVVTMWRRRSRVSAHPFPAAHQHRDGQELFLRDEVVAWLEDTGRGNNPDARADAAAHALLANHDRLAAEALSALLTLRHLLGSPLAGAAADPDDLLDLAEHHDPDDRYLFRELRRAADLTGLARSADELTEAAWNEATAHRRLVEAQLRPPSTGPAQVALTGQARRFLLALLGPLTRELGRPALMDPTGCAVDVLAETAAALELPALLMDGDSEAHRLTRRQLLLNGLSHRLIDRGDGDWSVAGPVVHLAVLPSAAEPTSSPAEQLNLIDEIALQLDDRELVLCLAPALTLTDPLEGEALARRDQLLRDGYVRAIVRLPAGLRPAQAREPSGLWLLAAAERTPPAERRTLVADLVDQTPEAEGLADDLLAAWQGAEGARRRAWAHLYPVPTRDLISASATLVPPRPARAPTLAKSGADWVVNLREADAHGRLAGYRFDVIDGTPEIVTIAQAMERGWVRVVPGRRLNVDGLPEGGVAVLGASPLPGGGRRPFVTRSPSRAQESAPQGPGIGVVRTVDRLALLAQADVDLTEPGDLVFTVRPRPMAFVDDEGGALVLSPARVLRVRPGAPLLSTAIAARINSATTTAWRTWSLATLSDADRAGLGEALGDLAGERARLVAELAALDALTNDLTQAVESRQLSIIKEKHGPTSL